MMGIALEQARCSRCLWETEKEDMQKARSRYRKVRVKKR